MLNRSVRNNGQGDNIVNSQNVNIFNKKLTSMRTTVTADFGPKNRNNVVRVFFDSVFFPVHFVAKRCILQQKCPKGQIGTSLLGTRRFNL